MKLFTLSILLTTIVFLVSCNKNKNESDVYINATEPTETGGIQKQDNLTSENVINTTVPDIAEKVENKQIPSQSPIAAINPEHGKPGHRCDIPVGAPLNSPAVKVESPKPQVITPLNIPAPASSGKINPAHGESGHRCDIPVGQPLT